MLTVMQRLLSQLVTLQVGLQVGYLASVIPLPSKPGFEGITSLQQPGGLTVEFAFRHPYSWCITLVCRASGCPLLVDAIVNISIEVAQNMITCLTKHVIV